MADDLLQYFKDQMNAKGLEFIVESEGVTRGHQELPLTDSDPTYIGSDNCNYTWDDKESKKVVILLFDKNLYRDDNRKAAQVEYDVLLLVEDDHRTDRIAACVRGDRAYLNLEGTWKYKNPAPPSEHLPVKEWITRMVDDLTEATDAGIEATMRGVREGRIPTTMPAKEFIDKIVTFAYEETRRLSS